MAQTTIDLEVIMRRLNRQWNKGRKQPTNRDKRRVDPRDPTGKKHLPPLTPKQKQIKRERDKKWGQLYEDAKPQLTREILEGNLGHLRAVPRPKDAHGRDINTSSLPGSTLPVGKGVNKKALERRLKNKNYTQNTGTSDDKWHRDRRVKKSQGRRIEETPKQIQTRKQIAREAVLRRQKKASA